MIFTKNLSSYNYYKHDIYDRFENCVCNQIPMRSYKYIRFPLPWKGQMFLYFAYNT